MTLKTSIPLLMLAVFVLLAPEASAQVGRVSGTVLDVDGKAIEGVTVTITSPATDAYKEVKTTNKKGKFTIAHPDVGIPYHYRFDKEGFQTVVVPVRVGVGTQQQQFVMPPAETAQDEGVGDGAAVSADRAVRTYNEGVEAQRLGDLDLAEVKYREASKINPDLSAAYTALSAVASLRQDWQESAAEAEAALAIDPDDVRAMQLRFDAYRNLGDEAKTAEAAAALREIGDLGAAAGRIYNEAVEAYQAGDAATAMSKLQQAVELDPDMVVGYVALAQLYLVGGSPAESAAMTAEALKRDPDNVRALKLGFDAARLAGDTETAANALDRLVELDPEWIRTVLFGHAGKLFNANEPVQAAFELEYVIKAYPDLARAHFMLGMALYNSGRAKEGREHMQTFIELAPDDPDVEIARGLMSYEE